MSDVFIDIGDEAKKQIEGLVKELLNAVDAVKKFNTEFKSVKVPSDAEKAIKKTTESIKTQNKAINEAEKLTKRLEQAKQKNLLATSKENKELLKVRLETNKINKETRESIKLNTALSSSYNKLTIRLTQAEKEYRDLAASQGLNSKATIKAQKNVNNLRTKIDSINQPIKRFSDNVGNYPKILGTATGFLKRFASAFGIFGGIAIFVRGLRQGVNVIRDFEKSGATLSAVLQKTSEETKELTDDAIRLGSETVKTAQEVTQLQIAFARLGFSQQEILELTESTIQGSIALNSELGSTAELVGAVVNTFDDFTSVDAPEILDILSLATAKSALNFEKLQTGLPIVSGAANAAGVGFTTLVALLGKLSDAGIDVSTSSTALRNIFIESANQGLEYSDILYYNAL